MSERRNEARGANEWNEIYGNFGLSAPAQLTDLPLNILDPWVSDDGRPQPFKPYSKTKLQRMTDSIRTNGIIEPICVRPLPNGRFQIIAGHNRVSASKQAGLVSIPARVRNLDDAAAREMMIDSNLQHRETLLPSEKALSYWELLGNLYHRGKRTDLTSDNHCPKLSDTDPAQNLTSDNDCPKSDSTWSHQVIATRYGVSATSVKQHLRLLELTDAWLDMVDNGAADMADRDPNILPVTFVAGYDISFLSVAEQNLLLSVVHDLRKVPTPAQAKQLHKASKEATLNEERILSILKPAKSPKVVASIKLPAERIASFFPQNTAPEVMEAEIYEALLAYRKTKKSPA